jgi:electron transport complex protein RnfC
MITVLENPIPLDGGIKLPQNKALTFQNPLRRATVPRLLIIPLHQQTGIPVIPVVQVGDSVLKGQLIARELGTKSTPVHASSSGVVKEISEHALPNSYSVKSECIVIETDGKELWIEDKAPLADYSHLSPLQLQEKIFQAGIVELEGGEFYSTLKNIAHSGSGIELLIINAAECEPYVSCNESVLLNYTKEVIVGIEILMHALQLDKCVIAIEKDKTEIVTILKVILEKYAGINIDLKLISSIYPADNDKLLIKSITGLDVPAEVQSVDVGVAVLNVCTVVAVKKAVIDDEPFISRIVTVTGPAVNQACNMEVLIGTPINEIIEQCGGYTEDFKSLIIGGPMRGFKLNDDKLPLIKTTNCLLALGDSEYLDDMPTTSCTKCDDCVPVCPVKLQPQQLYWYAKDNNEFQLNEFKLFDCIECGCCSYVCPSHIPLVYVFRQAKSRIWNKRRKQTDAEENKKRYLAKLARKLKQEEDKVKSRLKNFAQDKDDPLKKKQDAIAAAVNRVKKKRQDKNH